MGNFVNKLSNYQVIPRELIFDNTLSDRARFVYCYMASKPTDWDFLMNPMSKEIGYSVETLRKYINELVENGWLVKGEQKNEGVFGAVTYTLNESKTQNKEKTDDEQNEEEEETLDDTKNSDTEKIRYGEIPTQHNIDITHSRDDRNGNKERKDKSFSKKERIDYDAIVKCWNETNTLLPNVKMLNNKRKEQIRTLLASNNATVDDLMKAINIISMSSFCQGKNDRNWRASFDWLIKDTKSCFSRLFEGAYAFTQDEKNKLSQYLGQTASGGNPTLPNGLTKEQHDMYISKGYEVEMSEQTYTEETDDNIFINGQVYK